MSKPSVILVGGFLGAGKTTLLATAAGRLGDRGQRVGVITNDQASNLVDTALLKDGGLPVEEVSGGCFCCKFDELIGAIDLLIDAEQPDVLLGEPVGSCTDLSATVMQPIKALHGDRYRLAPFSVLVDPGRVREVLGLSRPTDESPAFPENVNYIFEKQLEEANLIALNKVDRLSTGQRVEIEDALRSRFPRAHVLSVSATEGTGVDRWLDLVMGAEEPGRTVTEVDYDVYAEGEAALGWLNAAYRLHADAESDWGAFCGRIMAALRREFTAQAAEIGHVKLHLEAGASSLVSSLTSNQLEPSMRGRPGPSPRDARLLINARAHISPAGLRSLVELGVAEAAGRTIRVEQQDQRCFAPARPTPTHRYHVVV